MQTHIKNLAQRFAQVRQATIHWCGPNSGESLPGLDEVFSLLNKVAVWEEVPELDVLIGREQTDGSIAWIGRLTPDNQLTLHNTSGGPNGGLTLGYIPCAKWPNAPVESLWVRSESAGLTGVYEAPVG